MGRRDAPGEGPHPAALWRWALVDVDPAILSDKAERINITLPARVLRRVDEAAKSRHESRSGFLARAALATLRREAVKVE